MKKLFLILFFLVFWSGETLADSITLRPRDCVIVQRCEFMVSGCEDHEDCVNESSPDDDETYVYTSNSGDDEEFYLDNLASGWDIDSLVIKIRHRKTGLFGMSACFNIGYIYWYGDSWIFQSVCSGLGTATSYATISCMTDEDEYSNPWTSATVNNHGFGLLITSGFGADQFRFTWEEVVVYGTAPAEEANRRRRIILLGNQ